MQEDRLICPFCLSDFIEIYDGNYNFFSMDQDVEEIYRPGSLIEAFRNFMHSNTPGNNFENFLRAFIDDRESISSDRRNYAIGPEYDEILERLLGEDKIEIKPAKKAFIDKLVVIHEKIECSVCLKSEKNDCVKFDCGHKFHWDCAMMWLEVKNTCPICRCELDSMD